jgi:hypothetical protein
MALLLELHRAGGELSSTCAALQALRVAVANSLSKLNLERPTPTGGSLASKRFERATLLLCGNLIA